MMASYSFVSSTMPKYGYFQASDDFTRIFYPTSKGNALWSPSPRMALRLDGTSDGYWTKGMLIGDLILRSPQGYVRYLWNVTLPSDDPRNIRGPRGFQHLVLDASTDVTVDPERFPACSTFGATNDCSKPFVTEELDAPHKLRITSAASEGAIFALPLGGASYECTPSGLVKLRDFALQHGFRWHEYVNGELGYDWTNGLMCLVTGCEKACYWASAFYINSNAGVENFSIDIDMTVSGNSQVFRRNDAFQGNVRSQQEGEDDSKDTTVARHCLAFRAFHISLKPSLFLELPYMKEKYANACVKVVKMDEPEKPSNRFSFLPRSFQPPVRSYEQLFPTFHPSLAINQLIHQSTPKLVIVLVHDNDIIAALELNNNKLPTVRELSYGMTLRSVIACTPDNNAYLIDRSEYDRGMIGRLFGLLRKPLASLGLLSFAVVDV
ncbi:hypothetical protein BDZ89DRAFT_1163102 [Hymenopellis radicata]|nr:hypothetical protein BDZ89DRAFT_1163102 [Hymenopellis radicata]